MIDWNVRVGDLLVLAGIAGTAILYAFRSGRFVETINTMDKQITELKDAVKNMAVALTAVAVQKERLDTMGQRQNVMDQRIEDLRNGRGYVDAQSRGAHGVDREY